MIAAGLFQTKQEIISATTDEAKAKMTELEIKNYEDKVKEGLLFGDTFCGDCPDKLRFVFSGV